MRYIVEKSEDDYIEYVIMDSLYRVSVGYCHFSEDADRLAEMLNKLDKYERVFGPCEF